jgi:hypothetical protein
VQLRTGLRLLFFERGNASTTENGPRLGRVREPSRSAFELAGAFGRFGVGGRCCRTDTLLPLNLRASCLFFEHGKASTTENGPRLWRVREPSRSAFELAGAFVRFGVGGTLLPGRIRCGWTRGLATAAVRNRGCGGAQRVRIGRRARAVWIQRTLLPRRIRCGWTRGLATAAVRNRDGRPCRAGGVYTISGWQNN